MHMSVKVYFLLLCTSAKSLKSNIVIFLADDLGIGDIGIYGNTTLKTPNIDRIGREGVKLEHHVSAASMCSPSRAALLTGRYPVRTGVASTQFRAIMNLACTAGLPPDEITFAEQAKKAGYHTAVMGKWHLGVFDIWRSYVHHPLNQGFDEFYGLPFTNLPDYADTQSRSTSWRDFLPQIVFQYLCVAAPLLWYYTTRYKSNIWFKVCFTLVTLLYACHYINLYNRCAFHGILMRGYDVVEQPVSIKGLTSRLVRESLEFLERRYLDNKPFLLYIPWHIPKTAVVPTRTFDGKTPHGQYGDCVEEMDWGVGEVLGALDRLGFTENTFVYFASDHGAHLEEAVDFNGGYNGIFRGGKGWGGVEGSIRVPGLIRWPGKIPTNQVVHEPTSLIDIFPTLSKIMGTPLPTDKYLDGRDILPLLRKDVTVSPHEYIMHYCGTELHAVTYRPRTGNTVWKVAYRFPDDKTESNSCVHHFPFRPRLCSCAFSKPRNPALLFDLTSDPSESFPLDLNSDVTYANIVQTVTTAVQEHTATLERSEMTLTPVTETWMPHLQLCCNFPLCRCKETKYTDSNLQ